MPCDHWTYAVAITFQHRHLSTSISLMISRKPVTVFSLALVCLMLLPGTALSGKVYKWVDKNGQVHFGQTPPSAENAEYDVRFAKEKAPPPAPKQSDSKQPGTASPVNAAEDKTKPKKKLTPQEQLAAIEKARAEQAKKAKEEVKRKAAKAEKCKKAQSNMRNVTKGGRIYDVDESGERRYWDDNMRAEKKKQAQEYIDKYCN